MVIQILSIGLGTDLVPAIGLGHEPADDEAMNRPPRGQRMLRFLMARCADGDQILASVLA
jgi:magnesium-transporting ATPase (P-type)